MHSAQPATPPLANPGGSSPGIRPFETIGGISQYQLGDGAPDVSGKQLAQLNLAIRELDVTDSSGHEQVVASYSSPLIVNVLQYQDGSGAEIGSSAGGAFNYEQLRVVLDAPESSATYVDGSSARLNFANDEHVSTAGAGISTDTDRSGRGQITITYNHGFVLGAGQTLSIDFNAFESVGEEHGNVVHVRPVLFTAVNSDAGHITGQVVGRKGDGVFDAVIVAVRADGTVANSAATDASGNFDLHTISAGAYRLDIYNEYTNAAGAHFTARGASSERDVIHGPTVSVTAGSSTSAGSIAD